MSDKGSLFPKRASETWEFNFFQKIGEFFSGLSFVFPREMRVITNIFVL
jgi:hypothetical protein